MKYIFSLAVLLSICTFSACDLKVSPHKQGEKGKLERELDLLPQFKRAQYSEDLNAMISAREEVRGQGFIFVHEKNPSTGIVKMKCDTAEYTKRFYVYQDGTKTRAELLLEGVPLDEPKPPTLDDLVAGMKKKMPLIEEHVDLLDDYQESVATFSERYARGPYVILEEDGTRTPNAQTIAGMSEFVAESEYSARIAETLNEIVLQCKEENAQKAATCKSKVSAFLSCLSGDGT